jgi:hypothetical protein
MAVKGEPTTLDLGSQRLLAVWAIKTIYLLELASRQQYPGKRPVEGYEPSKAETGWLLAELEQRPKLVQPPPRSMVWLACWECKAPESDNRASMVHYAPSRAPLPIPDGGEVIGHFTTLAIGYAAFQVFSVDFVEAEVRNARVWYRDPPDSLAPAIPIIWPHRLYAADVAWPPSASAFAHDSFDMLASWDMALRRP